MERDNAMSTDRPPTKYYEEHFDEIWEVLHGNENETDGFSVKWNKAVKDLEAFLKKYIKK